jgi:hypothetical protein
VRWGFKRLGDLVIDSESNTVPSHVYCFPTTATTASDGNDMDRANDHKLLQRKFALLRKSSVDSFNNSSVKKLFNFLHSYECC